jgi:hypothetical protein
MTKPCLHPYIKLNDNIIDNHENIDKHYKEQIVSVEDALAQGEDNHLYKVVHHPKDLNDELQEDTHQIVGIKLIDIQYDLQPCQLILMKNWTNYVRYQLTK